jgi:hypothetical protein
MAGFADQISQFTVTALGAADDVVAEAVQEIGRRLIERSPVDTTRFQSNWNYAAGAPDIDENPDARNVGTVNNIGAIPDKASAFTHFISNSLPYATALERGHSKQAPQGMVGLTAMEFPSIVNVAFERVKK